MFDRFGLLHRLPKLSVDIVLNLKHLVISPLNLLLGLKILRLMVLLRAFDHLFDDLQVLAQRHHHLGRLAEALQILLLVNRYVLPELGSVLCDLLLQYLVLSGLLPLDQKQLFRES